MLWKSTGDDQLRKYDFSYDAVNRLTGADFNQLTNNSFSKAAGIDFSVYGLSYDANGNILSMNQRGWKIGGSVTIDSLVYTYITGSNKLLNVIDRKNDTATRLGDFRSSKAYMNTLSQNKTVAATDYSYDPNGNMNLDNNKGISYIHYNHLNLPDSIAVTGKGHIRYIYDATGIKLKKITTDSAKVTTTLYLFGNYVNDALQFLGHEEGRVRFKQADSSLHYDYFLKDHLGNIRMVLTTEERVDTYPTASMEDVGDPANYIPYYSSTDYTENPDWRWPKGEITGYPEDTYTDPNEYVAKLDGEAQKIGPGKVLKVMAGDKVNLRVTSWYAQPGGEFPEPVNPFWDLLGAFSRGVSAAEPSQGHPDLIAERLLNTPGFNAGITQFLNTHVEQGYGPQAFVNWILLDEQFRFVPGSSGFEHVGDPGILEEHIREQLPVTKNGYLYIYISNTTPGVDVFFDNLQVTHERGPILEETHYYPFGLTMAGISSKALAFGDPQNKYKFNNGTEINADFSLSFYETECRLYDPQLGRFWQIDEFSEIAEDWSPYVFTYNNPINSNDPLGLFSEEPKETSTEDKPKELPPVYVVGFRGLWSKIRAYYRIDEWTNGDLRRVTNDHLRDEMYRMKGIVEFRERVRQLTWAQDKITVDIGSFFIPMGWLTKARYGKYALRLFQAKRGLTGLKAFKYATQFGIKTYRELKKLSPAGSEVHHLIEKRFAQLMGKNADDMASIVITKEEHQVFTNAWRKEIGYATDKAAEITTRTATRADVETAAREIYKDYPEILKALGL